MDYPGGSSPYLLRRAIRENAIVPTTAVGLKCCAIRTFFHELCEILFSSEPLGVFAERISREIDQLMAIIDRDFQKAPEDYAEKESAIIKLDMLGYVVTFMQKKAPRKRQWE